MSATSRARLTAHGARVRQYLFERDGDCVAVAEDDVADAVADENHVNARFVNDARGRVIVSGQADEALSPFFARTQTGRCHLFRAFGFEIGHCNLFQ
jgi:hypothetical protein